MNDSIFLKVIAGIFVLLAAIVVFFWVGDRPSTGPDASLGKVASLDFSGFTPGSVNRITIGKGSDQTVLEYRGDKWFVGDDEADEDKVKSLFDDLSSVKARDMVSQNEQNHAKFGVTGDAGITLTLTRSGEDSIFFVGNAGSTPDTFYLRKSGIQNVYLVEGPLREALSVEADGWKRSEEGEAAKEGSSEPVK